MRDQFAIIIIYTTIRSLKITGNVYIYGMNNGSNNCQ